LNRNDNIQKQSRAAPGLHFPGRAAMLGLEMDASPDRYETLAYVYSQSDLAILTSFLESEEIRFMTIGGGHASVDWPITIALGGVELRVHPLDGPRIRALLAPLDLKPYRGAIFIGNRFADALLVLMLFVLGLFAPVGRMSPVFLLEAPAAVRRQG
jgi:hypothetical protein